MLQEGHATLYSHHITSNRLYSTRRDPSTQMGGRRTQPQPSFTFTQEGGFHAFADSKKQGFHHNPAAIRLDRFDVATKIKEKC